MIFYQFKYLKITNFIFEAYFTVRCIIYCLLLRLKGNFPNYVM